MRQLYEGIRQHWASIAVIGATRLVLALLFLPTGLEKLLGVPFQRNLEPWTGFFFDALYAAGPYWQFIGFCQVVAAVMLLIPRFTFLGALTYASISANLVVITVGLQFLPGAIIATSLMLAASLGLILWDWDKLRVLLSATPFHQIQKKPRQTVRNHLARAWGHRTFRIVIAGVATLWLIVHILDRMASPALDIAVPLLGGILLCLPVLAFGLAIWESRLQSVTTSSPE